MPSQKTMQNYRIFLIIEITYSFLATYTFLHQRKKKTIFAENPKMQRQWQYSQCSMA